MAVKSTSQTQKFNYLKINGNGNLCISTTKEAYEKDKALNLNSIVEVEYNGTLYYQEEFKGGTILGYISDIRVVDNNFDGRSFRSINISVSNEEETDVIQMPLYRGSSASFNGYVVALAKILPNVDFRRKVTIKPTLIESDKADKNGKKYTNPFLFITHQGDDKCLKSFHKSGENGDLPPLEQKTKPDGTIMYDSTNRDTFLFNSLKNEIERFKIQRVYIDHNNEEQQNQQQTQPAVQQTQTTQNTQPTQSAQSHLSKEDFDDLPF